MRIPLPLAQGCKGRFALASRLPVKARTRLQEVVGNRCDMGAPRATVYILPARCPCSGRTDVRLSSTIAVANRPSHQEPVRGPETALWESGQNSERTIVASAEVIRL